MSAPFTGPAAHRYAEGPPRQVPGYDGLLRMTTQLLAEQTPPGGRVLVLGAGGGLELKAFADAHATWRFDGVDPSADMLAAAREQVGHHGARVAWHHGTIDVAPEGPFDAATCLLTFHFIAREARLPTLQAVRARLSPGAPFVLAHLSVPATPSARAAALARHVRFGAGPQAPTEQVERSCEAMATRLTLLAPEEEEALLGEAGFTGVTPFFTAFAVRGWVCSAGPAISAPQPEPAAPE